MELFAKNKRLFIEFKNITVGMIQQDLNGKKITL